MSQAVAAKGLEGVIAASTAVSHVYGEEGRLVYRGYDIHELAGKASFEEVAYLLWEGELPTNHSSTRFDRSLRHSAGSRRKGLPAWRTSPRTRCRWTFCARWCRW